MDVEKVSKKHWKIDVEKSTVPVIGCYLNTAVLSLLYEACRNVFSKCYLLLSPGRPVRRWKNQIRSRINHPFSFVVNLQLMYFCLLNFSFLFFLFSSSSFFLNYFSCLLLIILHRFLSTYNMNLYDSPQRTLFFDKAIAQNFRIYIKETSTGSTYCRQ